MDVNVSKENRTDSFDRTQELDWIIPITINIILLLASAWVLISLIHFGLKTGKWRSTQISTVDMLNKGLVYTSVVACAALCFLRYVFTLVHMNIGFEKGQDDLCDVLSDVTSSLYAFVLLAVAMFLWARQKTFYTSLLLKAYYAKPIRFFGRASIFFIVVFGIAVLVFSIFPNDHPSSPAGCTYHPDGSLRIAYWISIVFAIGFGQVSLLLLFAYALRTVCSSNNKLSVLRTHRTSDTIKSSQLDIEVDPVERLRSSSTVTNVSRSSSNAKDLDRRPSPIGLHLPSPMLSPPQPADSKELVKKVIRLTLIFAVTALLSDILIQVVSLFVVKSGEHRRVTTTLLNINAFLNLMFVIFSFLKYKKMLFSPCAKSW